jgi:hypothetical protein
VLKRHSGHAFQTFIAGAGKDETRPLRQDARNMATAQLRRHVERYLESRGLLRFEAPGAPAYYFPVGLVPNGKINYRAMSGRMTWKAVQGRSERHRVFWHLAMKVNFVVGPPGIVRFKPYICFSEDGRKAIDDTKRTSSIRRQFCRNWWNTQWRQLQEAFYAFLAGDGTVISIPVSGTQFLELSAKPIELTAARRMPDDLMVPEVPEAPPELEIDPSLIEDEDEDETEEREE